MELGKFGVWTTYRAIGEERASEAAKLVEDLGFGTFWLGGSPQLPALRPLLEATQRIVVATGILNVWASEPERVASDFAELEAHFPGRVLLGIGIGHPEATSRYSRPLAAMRAFLDGLDTAPAPVPQTRRCLAALGPKMLRLSAERSLGAHTYFVPVGHTRAARESLGESAMLAPELVLKQAHGAELWARIVACGVRGWGAGLSVAGRGVFWRRVDVSGVSLVSAGRVFGVADAEPVGRLCAARVGWV